MCSWLAARAVLLSSSLPVPLTSSSALCRLRFPMTVRLASDLMRGSLQTEVSHEGDELSVCLSFCLSVCLSLLRLSLSPPSHFFLPFCLRLSLSSSPCFPLSPSFSLCFSLSLPPSLSQTLFPPPTPLCLSLFLSHQTLSLIAHHALYTSLV